MDALALRAASVTIKPQARKASQAPAGNNVMSDLEEQIVTSVLVRRHRRVHLSEGTWVDPDQAEAHVIAVDPRWL